MDDGNRKKGENRGRRAFYLLLALALLFGGLVVFRTAFLQHSKGDLLVFLRTAWAVRAGEDIYAVTDVHGFHYLYPPLFAILLTPLALPPGPVTNAWTLRLAATAGLWYVLNLLCLIVAVHWLAGVLEEVLSDESRRRRWWALRLLPVLACLPPVGHTLMRAQVSLLLLLLLAGMTASLFRGRSGHAGLWLSAAICLKVIPAFLLLYPLWRRDWRFLAGCAGGLVVGLGLIPAAVFGPGRTVTYYREWTEVMLLPAFGKGEDRSRAGEVLEMTATDSQSLLVTLHNTLHVNRDTRPRQADPAVRRTAMLAGCGLTLLTLLAAGWCPTRDRVREAAFLGMLILLMLLNSPVCHLHYFCLSIPLLMAVLAAHWQVKPNGGRGGPAALVLITAIANALPQFPGLELARDLGLAMYAALLLGVIAGIIVWQRRGERGCVSAPRNREASLWQRLLDGSVQAKERPDWPRFAGADWPDRIMQVAATDDFHAKQGRSTGRWVARSGSDRLSVYLKRHYRLPRWRGLMATIRPGAGWSPAFQEWRHLRAARSRGLPVPAPVAAAEYIGPWGRLQSFLAVEELVGMLPLHQAVPAAAARLDPRTFARWKRGLTAELVRLTRALHDDHRFHKDLYLCHFFIPAEDVGRVPQWPGRVHLIDLHRLRRHRWTARLWQAKDLGQLLYSSELEGVTARDRLRFWRLYLGNGRRTPSSRLLLHLIKYKWRQYRSHNRKPSRRAQAA